MKPQHSMGVLPMPSSSSVTAPVVLHPFADMNCLQSVIDCLATTRRERQIEVREVARRARLKEATIAKAEQGTAIPCSHEFRAWSLALGMSWEQVWTLSLPR